MIIKQRITPYTPEDRKIIKFAFFPRQMKRDYFDDEGEWVWLERYVVTYKYSTSGGWLTFSKQRKSAALLNLMEQ
jgi:hypothetical protein